MNNVLAFVPGTGLVFGLLLAAAVLGGYAARACRVPKVIGYLLGGLVVHYLLIFLLHPVKGSPEAAAMAAAAAPLGVMRDLALGLILFAIGQIFERSHLKTFGWRIFRVSLWEVAGTAAAVGFACILVALMTQSDIGLSGNLALGLLLGTAAIATAPAATLLVLREYDAKGRVTDAILILMGINNAACIIAFTLMFNILAATGAVETRGEMGELMWLGLALTTVGSVVIGLGAGVLVCFVHGKLPQAESLMIFFTVLILLGAGQKWLLENAHVSYSFLLASLVMGMVFANVAIDPQKMDKNLRTMAMPIYAAFFALAGYSLHLEDLAHIGWIGGAYILARIAGKVLGVRLGLKSARLTFPVSDMLGAALLCQAAVVIGLAAFARDNWSDAGLAGQFATVVMGSVVVFELIGPLLTKRCVVGAGEVKAITLLRSGNAMGGFAILRLTIEGLFRLLGLRPQPSQKSSGSLRVKHIMRTHAQFLHADSPMDEVLHFIERSKHDAFPVIDDAGDFVGAIRLGDVREMIYDPALRDLVTAIDLADPDARVVPQDMPLEELLEVFRRQHAAMLPVVEHPASRRLIGLVEERDLLTALHRAR